MRRIRGSVGGFVLLALLVSMPAGRGVGPPVPSGKLTKEQARTLDRLSEKIKDAEKAKDFAEAIRLSEEVVVLRRRWQGPKHWQTIDAEWGRQDARRRGEMSNEARAELRRAERGMGRGMTLHSQGEYADAEAAFRRSLTLYLTHRGPLHPETATAYNNVAACLDARGKHSEALPVYAKALMIRKSSLGEEHPETAVGYHNLAYCLTALGKHADALPFRVNTLMIRKRSLGEEHPDTAASYSEAASCLLALGKPAEALSLYRRALAIREKVFGEKHIETAGSYNNLAMCLHAMGKSATALSLCEKGLAIRRKELGEQHADTATSYNNVASCLASQGKEAEALPLHRKALAIREKVLGENHPRTADSYNNVAMSLVAMGKRTQALPLLDKALGMRRRNLGDEHPDTAIAYNNLAFCLSALGNQELALTLYEKALAIRKKVSGEEHPDTATGYDNVASCLDALSKHAQALPLSEKALTIRRKTLGEEHPKTANSYNNVATCLDAQGKHAQAMPLNERALAIFEKVLGEGHPDTATAYNNVASCLDAQGKFAQAMPLLEKALAIRKKVLGEEHPHTADGYNNLAVNLNFQGKHAQALPLHEKALAIRRKVLGEEHSRVAASYNNIAVCLDAQGKHAQAMPLHEKALAIRKKILGEENSETATSYGNVAVCLDAQGKHAQALSYYEKALAIDKKVLGEDHPSTTSSYTNVAFCHCSLGNFAAGRRFFEASLSGHEIGRFFGTSSGFDRARAQINRAAPRAALAALHVRSGQPVTAWRYLEEHLGRGLLDDLEGGVYTEDAALRSALAKVDERLLPLFGEGERGDDRKALRDALTRQRRDILARAQKVAAARSAGLIWSLADIREQIPADAAVVVWLSALNERLACVLRREGDPVWVRLSGSGPEGRWTGDDDRLPSQLHRALSDRDEPDARRERLLAEVRKRWFAPLADSLKATKTLPAVRRLVVVPTGDMARLPVEAITADFVVSYTPSATVFARTMKGRRPLSGTSLLALGDPAFESKGTAGSRPSAVRGETYAPLPGTRFEVESLGRLVGPSRTTTLLGSDAGEAALADLAATGKLGRFRLIHLATHGFIDLDRPERSALVLSRDRLPTREQTLALAAKGRPIPDGHLRVETIRRDWKLDADLVTLSACETALGTEGQGDGLLGFSQALLSRGARAVVLSRWKVDDRATALLMLRFYENLLGRDKKKPMPRAEALAEAKRWLRDLPRKDAEGLAAALVQGKLSGTSRGSVVVLKLAKDEPPKLPAGDRPFAHPAYWAAFVLMGDPN